MSASAFSIFTKHTRAHTHTHTQSESERESVSSLDCLRFIYYKTVKTQDVQHLTIHIICCCCCCSDELIKTEESFTCPRNIAFKPEVRGVAAECYRARYIVSIIMTDFWCQPVFSVECFQMVISTPAFYLQALKCNLYPLEIIDRQIDRQIDLLIMIQFW